MVTWPFARESGDGRNRESLDWTQESMEVIILTLLGIVGIASSVLMLARSWLEGTITLERGNLTLVLTLHRDEKRRFKLNQMDQERARMLVEAFNAATKESDLGD